MADRLLSVGLDVGTTSTQMIVSRLWVENCALGAAVPELGISRREILYQSPVHFTPLLDENRVDGQALRRLVEREYAAAGITRAHVDTGAVIVTGETSRKENAGAVLENLSGLAGDFVVATAGPDLESVLAARGAGAVAFSRETGKTVLHMDIGGGTSNLAWIADGQIQATGCLNVGGRLIRFDQSGVVTYVSPALSGLCELKKGEQADFVQLETVATLLCTALEMAAGLRTPTALLTRLLTAECAENWHIRPATVISFSGGVAECIRLPVPWETYGDLGPVLARVIQRSPLCAGAYRLSEQAIRATVIGAGCHSTQLSGSTVFYRNAVFPMKNLPVVPVTAEEQHLPPQKLGERIRQRVANQEETPVILALAGRDGTCYEQVRQLADGIVQGWTGNAVLVALERDMAKALGQALALRLPPEATILCIDRVCLRRDSYLDVGVPVGPALPVVIKTLILPN